MASSNSRSCSEVSGVDSSTSNKSRGGLRSTTDPRLCPRVLVNVIPPQGRKLSAPLDTVKVVHSYLKTRPARKSVAGVPTHKSWENIAGSNLSPSYSVWGSKDNSRDVPQYQNLTPLKPVSSTVCVRDTSDVYYNLAPHLTTIRDAPGVSLGGEVKPTTRRDVNNDSPSLFLSASLLEQQLLEDSECQALSRHKQLTAYVAWVNSQLKKKLGAHLVEDLRHDIRDGVVLINLIEVISEEKIEDVHLAPSTHSDMRDNVDKILQFMHSRKIKMHHITTRDIVEGNLKAIMRLILALAAHYKPNSVRHSSQPAKQNITGIAQGAAAALTEARRNATRAGHRYRKKRQRDEIARNSDRRIEGKEHSESHCRHGDADTRAELEGASGNSSPVSSQNASPRASLYLSDPPSSMEGLLAVSSAYHRGGGMVTSCESDSAMGDSGYSEICDTLKETHEMLFSLHELLLTGHNSGDARSPALVELEASNSKETIVLLKGRLLHAEEVAGSLRAELTKVKKDCLELQGTKAGLQQRLKDQEGNLSTLKSEVMSLELEREKQTVEIETLKKQLEGREQLLSDVQTTCVRQAEDRDRAVELKRELSKKDHMIKQLNEQLTDVKENWQQPTTPSDGVEEVRTNFTKNPVELDQDLMEQRLTLLDNCLRRLTESEKTASLQASELELTREQLLENRLQVCSTSASSLLLDHLEDTILALLGKVHLNGTSVVAPVSGRSVKSNHNPPTPARRPLNATLNTTQNWRFAGGKDVTPKVTAARTRPQALPSCSTPASRVSSTKTTSSYGQSSMRVQQGSTRGPASSSLTPKNSSNISKVARSQIPRPQGTPTKKLQSPIISDAQTSVLYYIDPSDKPLTCIIHKQLAEIRLRDFKAVIEDSNLFHYFFQVLDPEYGTIREEVSNDDDLLPGWEGKIVAWLQVENGTAC